ncbi:unnamed protein product [Arctia plantaginis]|uniref:Uncharacterized protein n=1 Tax=Arctia plantaginis TaxID=874455 RepID=A0A8S1AGZ3_ARCPL|nr:unnamed protein product [Arctia plantaginis]
MSTYSADVSLTTTTTSCSDCKLELFERRWTQLLLRWLNKCVYGKPTVTRLSNRSLIEVTNKYKDDICSDDLERAYLNSEDLEPFLKLKYPILRLSYFCEEKEFYKRLYIQTSVLLYHCCVSSINGQVDSDICSYLEKTEQELILKFCERLTDMEVTFNNVECAIKDACEAMTKGTKKNKKKPPLKVLPEKPMANASGESCYPSNSTLRASSKISLGSEASQRKNIKFKSSITVLPSAVTETSSCTDVDYEMNYSTSSKTDTIPDKASEKYDTLMNLEGTKNFCLGTKSSDKFRCIASCSCSRCAHVGVACGDSGELTSKCLKKKEKKMKELSSGYKYCFILMDFPSP